MKPFALASIYAVSLGAVVLAIEQGYIDADDAGGYLIGWALVGLAVVVVGVFRND